MSSFALAQTEFLHRIEQPQHCFAHSLAFIDTWFEFTPSNFCNNGMTNSHTENHGSAKIFALAILLKLSKQQALLCFGEHYRNLAQTPSNSHLNIRMLTKDQSHLAQIRFDHFPLQAKGKRSDD